VTGKWKLAPDGLVMRNNPAMTPQRWKGAGILFLVIAALLVVAATVSALSGSVTAVAFSNYQYVPPGLFGGAIGQLRAVVLGAFAGVAVFIGLACFAWSGLVEAKEQRAEILVELTALRLLAKKTADTEKTDGTEKSS
jgi:hypothetical protein